MREFHLHLVSDATGETVYNVARACVSQFDEVHAGLHRWNLMRTERQLDLVLDALRRNPGIVMYTMVDSGLRSRLEAVAHELGVPCIDVLKPMMVVMTSHFGVEGRGQPGRQHSLDADYFRRIDAFDFALAHDDGQSVRTLHRGDVVLVGVSRTSKTPTSIYLANQGIKTGNVPFVRGCAMPHELDSLDRVLVVGLTKDPAQLVSIRRTRFRFWKQREDTAYVDQIEVSEEVRDARRYFQARQWPVIDVSQRSIEETAAEIVILLDKHRERIASQHRREPVGALAPTASSATPATAGPPSPARSSPAAASGTGSDIH